MRSHKTQTLVNGRMSRNTVNRWFLQHRHFAGDVLGLLLDIEGQQVIFYLNGKPLPPYNQVFKHAQ